MPGEAEVLKKVSRKRKIPDSLVREIIDGKPFYYKGYKDVLRKKKTKEDIIAWQKGAILLLSTKFCLT